jgi:succinoglycan biosynthesis transport protein ExoP
LTTFTGVQQVGKARPTPLPISPTPKKNAIFGFVIGLIAGCVLAYLLARFDRRLRTFSSVEPVLQAQVLAALPTVRSPTLRPGGVRAPAPALVEPLRRLNTALQLSHSAPGRSDGPRLMLFISPDPGDGRSTLVANLARVKRDAGERVAVVEADFRRPALGRLMGLPAARGLADVLTGVASPHAAMQVVQANHGAALPQVEYADAGGLATATAVGSNTEGVLAVLQSGGDSPNPPAMLGSEAMAWLLRTLAEEYDAVLIDAPCPLEVSDALPLFPLVEGLVIVARMGHTRIVSAERLLQLVERAVSAPTLGAVINGVSDRDIERHGFYVPSSGGRRRLLTR